MCEYTYEFLGCCCLQVGVCLTPRCSQRLAPFTGLPCHRRSVVALSFLNILLSSLSSFIIDGEYVITADCYPDCF